MPETVAAIEAKEREETTDWVNYRNTHSDGLKYGDLDARFYEAALQPGGGPTTYETRRRNFRRLNKNVSWDNPSGLDLDSVRREMVLAKRLQEASDKWNELDGALERIVASKEANNVADSDELIDLVTQILRAETAIATNGQKPEVATRVSEAMSRVVNRDVNLCLLRAAVGARLTDSNSSDKVKIRREKARRTALKVLATAVGKVMAQGAWAQCTPADLFDVCGSAATYALLQSSGNADLNDAQVASAIINACMNKNVRELTDLVSLVYHRRDVLGLPSVIKSIADFSYEMCCTLDGDDASSTARIALSLASLGSMIEAWKIPIFEGLHRARPELQAMSIVSKVARRFVEVWENNAIELASKEIIMCMEEMLMNDLISKGEWLEAKSYASTRDELRQIFMESAKNQGDINDVTNTLESTSLSHELPILVPKRRIVFIDDVSGLLRVRETLSATRCRAVAFDCEWRDPRPLSTLQFSPAHTQETFIIDATSANISREDLASFIAAIFSDLSVKKLAFAPEQDWRRLRVTCKSSPISNFSHLPVTFHDANVIDLQGGTSVSLASVVADTLGFTLDKRCQRSNWDKRPLSQQQMFYAALDAEVLLDIAVKRGVVEAVEPEARANANARQRDAHLYETDSILFRDRTPNFGAELNASDISLFSTDARAFGADLWESDRLLYTSPESIEHERKEASLKFLEKSAFVDALVAAERECAICLSAMMANEKLIRLNCTHVYHASCLISAMKNSDILRCPTCRTPVTF